MDWDSVHGFHSERKTHFASQGDRRNVAGPMRNRATKLTFLEFTDFSRSSLHVPYADNESWGAKMDPAERAAWRAEARAEHIAGFAAKANLQKSRKVAEALACSDVGTPTFGPFGSLVFGPSFWVQVPFKAEVHQPPKLRFTSPQTPP